jgi:hypothetical protein
MLPAMAYRGLTLSRCKKAILERTELKDRKASSIRIK